MPTRNVLLQGRRAGACDGALGVWCLLPNVAVLLVALGLFVRHHPALNDAQREDLSDA